MTVKEASHNNSKTVAKPAQRKSGTGVKKLIYDRTFVLHELKDMLQELRDDETIKSKAHLFRNRFYSSQKFSQWKRRYEATTSIQELLKKIEEIIESRLVEQGLNGKAIPMTIFLLKNYYNYTDQYQQQIDQTVSFKVNRGHKTIDAVVLPRVSPKQLKP